ncbi:homoserine O-acetyltransferase MetA [Cuneatibacter caecimuris]|uniref:Homoserine O-acetyltransferase n=1 Tax=Cuneatibacter caecimuris TaxID=1796618 RepID=A0A4Q7NZI8_9FIRM|nr:homoserine O-succinyltransferase [Cuneatibacter caecimuris]RZS92428.1 homoserine O-succinyltransferase [Cuneatibacter caecimuris]
MPIKVQNDLPARAVLESENIFMMDESRAATQDIRPLEIVILNLMPLKQSYETQLLRALSNTPLQVEVTYLTLETHESRHTSASHLNKFYTTFSQIRKNHYDGMIITGAPVETMAYEEVNYWGELSDIMEWTKTHVTSTFHVCWGAMAGMYYHFGIPKIEMPKKLSGVYRHRVLDKTNPLVRSFDDEFMAPHSRYSGVSREAVLSDPELLLLAESEEAGVYLASSRDGRQIFVFGHPEYDRMTLDFEYNRDKKKGLNPDIPEHYYEEDDPANTPLLTWRGHANTLYSNWLNFFVYQETPYRLERD